MCDELFGLQTGRGDYPTHHPLSNRVLGNRTVIYGCARVHSWQPTQNIVPRRIETFHRSQPDQIHSFQYFVENDRQPVKRLRHSRNADAAVGP